MKLYVFLNKNKDEEKPIRLLGLSGCYRIISYWQILNGTRFDAGTLFGSHALTVDTWELDIRKTTQQNDSLVWWMFV